MNIVAGSNIKNVTMLKTTGNPIPIGDVLTITDEANNILTVRVEQGMTPFHTSPAVITPYYLWLWVIYYLPGQPTAAYTQQYIPCNSLIVGQTVNINLGSANLGGVPKGSYTMNITAAIEMYEDGNYYSIGEQWSSIVIPDAVVVS